MRHLWLGLLVLAAFGLAPAPAAAAKRVALVIGNSGYQAVGALPNPMKDASIIAKTLQGLGFETDLATDLTAQGFRDALKTFSGLSQTAEIALVYYAGHGVEFDGTNFLVPIDAKLARKGDVRFEAIALEDVREAASGASKLRLVILDACRNNPFPMLGKDGVRGVSRGLAKVEPGANELVAYAARENTVAADGDGDNSPFATALAKRLGEPGVEINFLFRRVRDDVLQATGNSQEPFVYGTLGVEEIYLNPAVAVPIPEVQKPAADAQDSASSNALKTTPPSAAQKKLLDPEGVARMAMLDAIKDPAERAIKVNCTETLVRLSSGWACHTVGDVIQEEDFTPSIVLLPAGESIMGSNRQETAALKTQYATSQDFFDAEFPEVKVKITRSFAVGRSHVTRGEFAAFVADTGYQANSECFTFNGKAWKSDKALTWQTPGFPQDDQHPVVCVSLDDARAYVKWLSDKTGGTYRLMSEAEAEYAARGGSTTKTRFSYGKTEAGLCDNANGADLTAKTKFSGFSVTQCKDGFVYTAPVASFKPNGFGLYDVAGNVWSWTDDCWNESNKGNPGNGAARKTGDCARIAVRGGSWMDSPQMLHTALRNFNYTDGSADNLGFRVARTIDP